MVSGSVGENIMELFNSDRFTITAFYADGVTRPRISDVVRYEVMDRTTGGAHVYEGQEARDIALRIQSAHLGVNYHMQDDITEEEVRNRTVSDILYQDRPVKEADTFVLRRFLSTAIKTAEDPRAQGGDDEVPPELLADMKEAFDRFDNAPTFTDRGMWADRMIGLILMHFSNVISATTIKNIKKALQSALEGVDYGEEDEEGATTH
jgi:hypothetical protein